MSARTEQGPTRVAVGGRRWVTALAGGIVVWFLRLVIATALVRPACQLGLVWGRVLLASVTVVGCILSAACLWLSLRIRRATTDDEPWWDAVGLAGALINGVSLIAILTESIPILFVDACR